MRLRSLRTALMAGTALILAHASAADAASYAVSVQTGLTSGAGFQTLPTVTPFTGSIASAAFTYTGALNFVNNAPQNNTVTPLGDLNSAFGFSNANVSGYSGSGTVTFAATQVANYATLSSFLGSSGSVGGYGYGSLYTITLGALAAGTNLVINHDDGISLFRGGVQVAGGVVGPTSQVTDTFTNLAGGNYTLYYSRQNGTPSVLQVTVPEPASLALFGAGLFGLAMVRRRKAATRA